MNIQNYKFRASALGNIVTKSGKLTDKAKTYIQECYIGLKWGVKKEAYGRALEKGIATEQDIIQLINETIYKGDFVTKVKESKQNEWIMGTADVDHKDIIYDCKSAFDIFSFGKANLTWLYEWQLKAYCFLYGREKARLFYGLVNMPLHMIMSEQRSLFYRNPGKWLTMEDEDYIKACDELEDAHTYDSIPIINRFKVWDVKYTKDDESKIIEAVKQAREYMNELAGEDEAHVLNNMELCGLAALV
jgi:hypothetical protein